MHSYDRYHVIVILDMIRVLLSSGYAPELIVGLTRYMVYAHRYVHRQVHRNS